MGNYTNNTTLTFIVMVDCLSKDIDIDLDKLDEDVEERIADEIRASGILKGATQISAMITLDRISHHSLHQKKRD